MIDSPARREAARRLLRGDSIVFLLLEGRDKKANDAAAKLLGESMAGLQKSVRLPAPDGTVRVRMTCR